MIEPLVMTPRDVYIGPLGFFFTPMISRLNVHLSSGCVTWAFVNRKPDGRINLSYLGGFLVKPGPTNVALVTILFHCLAANNNKPKQVLSKIMQIKPRFSNNSFMFITPQSLLDSIVVASFIWYKCHSTKKLVCTATRYLTNSHNLDLTAR